MIAFDIVDAFSYSRSDEYSEPASYYSSEDSREKFGDIVSQKHKIIVKISNLTIVVVFFLPQNVRYEIEADQICCGLWSPWCCVLG